MTRIVCYAMLLFCTRVAVYFMYYTRPKSPAFGFEIFCLQLRFGPWRLIWNFFGTFWNFGPRSSKTLEQPWQDPTFCPSTQQTVFWGYFEHSVSEMDIPREFPR